LLAELPYIPYCRDRRETKVVSSKLTAENNAMQNNYKTIKNHIPSVEHRVVMECFLGRKLTAEEVVHHVNNNKRDNRIENLLLLPNRLVHNSLHAGEYCPKGHKFTVENTQLKGKNGNSRRCRECHRLTGNLKNNTLGRTNNP
jgi:hypothetical protein